MKAIDASQNAVAAIPDIKAKGIVAVGRYYSIYKSKVLTKKEAELISAAGLSLFVVYEDGNKPTDFDSSQGVFNAQHALQCASAVGQPEGSTIYFAVDFDSTENQINTTIIPYFQAIASVFQSSGKKYGIGVYGNGLACGALLDKGLCKVAWLSNSTAYGGYKAFYNSKCWALAQHLPVYYGSLQADPNEINGDFGSFKIDALAPAVAAGPEAAPLSDALGATDATPWMDWMRQHLGEIQQTGAVPTPFTESIFKHTTYGPLNGYTPESCAATVCAALEECGYVSTKSAAAVSYQNYGEPCELKPGCIVVYKWTAGQHHVDFCDRIIDANTILGLGGNQGHSLRDSQFSTKFIIATRWPVKAAGAVVAAHPMLALAAVATPTFTVHQGQRYRAIVNLTGFEMFATNDIIAEKLTAVGFQNVVVTGSGAQRQVEGTWAGPDTTAQLDSHLSDVTAVT